MISFDEPTCGPPKPGTYRIESSGGKVTAKNVTFLLFPQILPYQVSIL